MFPAKVGGYLRRLHATYSRTDDSLLAEIVSKSKFLLREHTVTRRHDDAAGHELVLFLPLETISKVSLDEDPYLRGRLADNLNTCAASLTSEFIHVVALELENDSDPEFQRSQTFSSTPTTSPDAVSFWKPGLIRVFVSHRDTHKAKARVLSDALAEYGVSCFVAHDTIEPMTTWREEIRKGLDTMEVMLAFITDDFNISPWTSQEIGYAAGKGVPIVSLQLEQAAPSALLDQTQAIRASLDQVEMAAPKVFSVLADKLGSRRRLQGALVAALATSTSYSDAKERFDRLERVARTLSNAELELLVTAFSKNDQLYGGYLIHPSTGRLIKFIERATGRRFEIVPGRPPTLRELVRQTIDDEIPF